MAKNKFYAVRSGRVPGVYTSWAECEKQVHKYNGAIFKAFATRQEAEDFVLCCPTVSTTVPQVPVSIDEHEVVVYDNPSTAMDLMINNFKLNRMDFKNYNSEEMIAYVDGSYESSTKRYSYGLIIFYKNVFYIFGQSFEENEYSAHNNVAGEVLSSMRAMTFAKEHNPKKIHIYHDYEGVEKWATGQWKTNHFLTTSYKEFVMDFKNYIPVEFHKVKSHSSDKYNDIADTLAKAAFKNTINAKIETNINEKIDRTLTPTDGSKVYDIIIIGTGAANIVADEAIKHNKKVAIVEMGKFGGTCLNRGCIPTKVLTTAADALLEIKEYEKIGVKCESASFNWDMIKQRVFDKTKENEDVYNYYNSFENVDVYKGTAAFVRDNKIIVKFSDRALPVEKLTSEKIVIATGASTKIPNILGLNKIDYITTETFFDEKFPDKPYEELIVVGGGVIGCEFSHIFNAFGSKVHIVQHNKRLLPKEDEEISEAIRKSLEKRGIDINLNVDTTRVWEENNRIYLEIKDITTGEISVVEGSHILICPGVKPNTGQLNLSNTNIKLAKNGYILTNEFMETSVEGVYALGDINGVYQLRHKANYEAEVLSHNIFKEIFDQNIRWVSYDNVPSVTFTYPQVAHVGLSEREAIEMGYEIYILKNNFANSAKGYAMGIEKEDNEFVKIIVDRKSDRILGAHIIGHQASILIQSYVTELSLGNKRIVPINEHIATNFSKSQRNKPLTRNLVPGEKLSNDEIIIPHPSLSEATAWTRYYEEVDKTI